MTPTEEAKYAINYGVSRADLSPAAQAEYDRLVAEGYSPARLEERQPTRGEYVAYWTRGNYYPVGTYNGSAVHLMYSRSPRVPFWTFTYSLCGKRVINSLPGAVQDATCPVCRLKAGVGRRGKVAAGEYDYPPDDPSVLKGRCPKCSRPVVWYKEGQDPPACRDRQVRVPA